MQESDARSTVQDPGFDLEQSSLGDNGKENGNYYNGESNGKENGK